MVTSADSYTVSLTCINYYADLQTVLEVCSEGGLLPAPLVDAGPTSQLVQVSFTPRYLMQCTVYGVCIILAQCHNIIFEIDSSSMEYHAAI